MNRMKSENYIPDFVRKADVTTIYKGKGDKFDLENDRGIFLVTTFRSILMKLIYIDKYSIIEENMSDSQIGGRKGKNVRNHVWVLNGIIADIISRKKKHPIDIQIYDYKQCFASLPFIFQSQADCNYNIMLVVPNFCYKADNLSR